MTSLIGLALISAWITGAAFAELREYWHFQRIRRIYLYIFFFFLVFRPRVDFFFFLRGLSVVKSSSVSRSFIFFRIFNFSWDVYFRWNFFFSFFLMMRSSRSEFFSRFSNFSRDILFYFFLILICVEYFCRNFFPIERIERRLDEVILCFLIICRMNGLDFLSLYDKNDKSSCLRFHKIFS